MECEWDRGFYSAGLAWPGQRNNAESGLLKGLVLGCGCRLAQAVGSLGIDVLWQGPWGYKNDLVVT